MTRAELRQHLSILPIAFAALAALALPSAALSQQTAKANTNINVRASTDPQSRIIATLRTGQEVEVVEESGEFTQVRTADGKTGFLKTKYLEVAQPPVVAEPAPEAVPITPIEPVPPVPPPVAEAPASEPESAADDATRLEGIEVTGSRLTRTDMETPAPVIAISREQILSTGATSLGEILKIITSNEGGLSQEGTLGFAAGSSSINLRGLGAQYSLVLLNGRRIAPYGRPNVTSANIEPSVNLDSIPIGAIERIEILPNGGSAIYGSDAVAGVLNIITKRNYNGTALDAYYGTPFNTSYSGTSNVTLTAGAASPGVSTLFFLNYYKTSGILQSDRDISSDSDQSRLGGLNLSSGVGFPATVILVDDSGNPVQRDLCPPRELAGVCRTNRNAYTTLEPPVQRLSVFGSVNKELFTSADFSLNGYFEALYAHSNTQTSYYPTPVSTNNDGDLISGIDNPFTRDFIDSVNASNTAVSGDPDFVSYQDTWIQYDFREVGSRLDDYEDLQSRYVLGFKGGFSSWNYDVGGLFTENRDTDYGTNYVSKPLMVQALTTGLDVNGTGVPEYFNVFGQTFGEPATTGSFPNSEALVNALRVRLATRAISTIRSLDATVGGPVVTIPGIDSTIALAVGVERRLENFSNAPDSHQSGDNVVALSSGTPIEGNRSLTSLYGEIDVPFSHYAEVQFAARHEEYSDFGNVTKPKVAVKVTPVEWLVLRAGADRGFRAPSLADLFAAQSSAFQGGIIDTPRCATAFAAPTDCDGSGLFKITVGGNPDLEAEESKSYYYGFVVEPIRDLSMGLNTFDVRLENVITTLPAQLLVDSNIGVVRGPPTGAGDPGPILNIFNGFLNGAELRTQGFDADIAWRLPGAIFPETAGRLKTNLAATYIDKYIYADSNFPSASYAGGNAFGVTLPRVKANWDLNYAMQQFNATLRANYVGHFNDDIFDGREIEAHTTWDVQGVMQIGQLQGLKATVGVNNVLDEMPPFIAGSAFYTAGFLGYDPSLYTAVGRFAYVAIGYEF
jgi:iron complex outermembrane recepter protein